ncbi:Non-canonical non-ribosomal peptide synthetase FUB8 [Lachnellula arida]|uniref:Non-canonical non-ribosomal peptide synthetase FUB8 n=1 Tax=Lachnellula arida TaxID=1316785 RepID=A0A8T9BBK6_9HELO|nr:Non-canonical non-ribosomal peptide synthetase FUB8 [Lachnellula arida]
MMWDTRQIESGWIFLAVYTSNLSTGHAKYTINGVYSFLFNLYQALRNLIALPAMESRNQNIPPNCGRRLLPTLIDEYARSEPDRTFVAIPLSTDLRDGWKDVNYLTYARAINWCSWWIEENLGRGKDFDTISYMGPLDLRYLIILMGAVKTGYTAFFSSNRNSLNAHLSLLESTQCNILVVAEEGAPTIYKQIISKRQMRTKSMPALDLFLNLDENVAPYPFNKTFAEARFDPLIIMHTSGSTGFPKPVFVKHGTWAAMDAYQMIPPSDEGPLHSDYLRGKRVLLNLPMFHGACECFIYGMGVYGGAIPLLPPPGPRTAEVMDMAHRHGHVFGSIAPPSVLKDLYEMPSYFDGIAARVSFLGFAGGSLSKETGDKISKSIKVIGFFGSTETAYLPCRISSVNDWIYYNYSHFLGHDYRPRKDGRHEMVIVRNTDFDLYQSIFSTFPQLIEYSTADIYEQHPEKPGYWAHRGRADDIIAFSSGEKTNPISFEETMTAHPEVKAAYVGGNNEFQASLLIEPKVYPASEQQRASLIDNLWPTVETANRDCPAHARVLPNFIIFAKPNKPFPRAGKETIQRASIPELYAEEFEELYANATKARNVPGIPQTVQLVQEARADTDLRDSLRHLIATNSWLVGELDNQTDLFEAGLDSLQLPGLVNQINSFLSAIRPDLGAVPVSMKAIYTHRNVGRLVEALEQGFSEKKY